MLLLQLVKPRLKDQTILRTCELLSVSTLYLGAAAVNEDPERAFICLIDNDGVTLYKGALAAKVIILFDPSIDYAAPVFPRMARDPLYAIKSAGDFSLCPIELRSNRKVPR
ncbi:MAG: hypothetical protein C4293_19605 [Nitrospiraceae bacterium]